jgi:hypothetical protein
MSVPLGQYSTDKNRQNNASGDILNAAYSSDATSLQDSTVSSSSAGDHDIPEDKLILSVLLVPKDLSSYKSPP